MREINLLAKSSTEKQIREKGRDQGLEVEKRRKRGFPPEKVGALTKEQMDGEERMELQSLFSLKQITRS